MEHEAALEDMHMFFVAFNKRQKKIVEGLEIARQSEKILDELSPNKTSNMNVQVLDEELDIE